MGPKHFQWPTLPKRSRNPGRPSPDCTRGTAEPKGATPSLDQGDMPGHQGCLHKRFVGMHARWGGGSPATLVRAQGPSLPNGRRLKVQWVGKVSGSNCDGSQMNPIRAVTNRMGPPGSETVLESLNRYDGSSGTSWPAISKASTANRPGFKGAREEVIEHTSSSWALSGISHCGSRNGTR